MSQTVYLQQGSIQYELGTGAGCWAKSYEDAPIGTVRIIKNVQMYAWTSYKRWWGIEVWWSPVDKEFNTYENARAWIASSV